MSVHETAVLTGPVKAEPQLKGNAQGVAQTYIYIYIYVYMYIYIYTIV